MEGALSHPVPAENAIPVAVDGVPWITVLIAITNLLLGGGLVAWIRSRPRMKEIEVGSDEKLRTDLLHRVETLERKLDEKDAQHAAEMAIMRHRVNNSDQCIDALLMLLETAPDKAAEAVAMIKEMRARQREAEAIEKAAFHSAIIQSAAKQKVAA